MLSLTSQPTVRPVQSASRAWFRLAVAAIGVGLISLLTNVTSLEQLSGADQEFAAIRKILTRLTNAGVLWAGVAFLGGWLVRRPAPAIIAGTAGLVIALVTHYGFASLTGLMPWTDLASNYLWFLSALLFGPPLGLIGACAAAYLYAGGSLEVVRFIGRWTIRAAVVLFWAGFLTDYPLTRDIYFTVAMLHVLAEVPFLLRLL